MNAPPLENNPIEQIKVLLNPKQSHGNSFQLSLSAIVKKCN
jgi:hypothetical protein